jgi:NADPH2:quinone reductase
VQAGQTILWHAAAGGVGQLAAQWAKALGCTVIGTAGGPEKTALATAAGCAHVIDYRTERVADRVKAITGGAGVPVVYDSVGKDTFETSLECLASRGMLVSFGQSSGPVPEVNPRVFAPKSLYYTRPSLFTYCAARPELEASAERLFNAMALGSIRVEVRQRYPLADAAQAHRDLEGRRTTGSTVLLP